MSVCVSPSFYPPISFEHNIKLRQERKPGVFIRADANNWPGTRQTPLANAPSQHRWWGLFVLINSAFVLKFDCSFTYWILEFISGEGHFIILWMIGGRLKKRGEKSERKTKRKEKLQFQSVQTPNTIIIHPSRVSPKQTWQKQLITTRQRKVNNPKRWCEEVETYSRNAYLQEKLTCEESQQ